MLSGAPASESAPNAHALIVGSNAGGLGQEGLRFAEDDAARIFDVLESVGRYKPERMRLLRSPHRADILRALDQIEKDIAYSDARGERSSTSLRVH